jgi:arylsulfatase A-like enzyme
MSQVTTERSLVGRVRALFEQSEQVAASPSSGSDTAAVRRGQAEMLSLAIAVCAAIALTKGLIAYRDLDNAAAPPLIYDGSAPASLARVVACCAEDIAVGATCLLGVMVALRRLRSSRAATAVRVLAHLAAVAALAFLLVNAQLFHVVRHFLTLRLIQLAGGFHWDRSISANITPSFKLALALLPTLTIAAHLAVLRAFPRLWLGLAGLVCRPVVLVAALLAVGGVGVAARHGLVITEPGDYPRNPHLLFVRSLFAGLFVPDFAGGADDETADLLPGRPGHTPGLLAKPPRNIILISAESVGTRYLQTYGCPMETTPRLCRLAEEGKSLTFDNFYATANHTIASALPIFGGLYNDPTTLATVIEYPDFPTPLAPAWLQGQGYVTGFFSSGGRSTWEDYRNMVPAFASRGFDVGRDPANSFWQAAPKPDAFLDRDHLDEAAFADVRRAVRTFRDRKFALWVWTYDTHNPYFDGPGPKSFPSEHFPAAVAGRPDKEAAFQTYLRAVWRLDALIGGLCDELEQLGLADDTLIVLTGDHGEEFGDHGWFGHNWSLYEEEVHVPCVLICPRLAALGRRSATVGGHVDLWATITDVCALPADPRWQGRSLLGSAGDRRAYFYRGGSEFGVRDGKYKYIWDYEQSKERLYNLAADPTEQRNLAQDEPGLCAVLQRRVKSWAGFQKRLTKERMTEAGQ